MTGFIFPDAITALKIFLRPVAVNPFVIIRAVNSNGSNSLCICVAPAVAIADIGAAVAQIVIESGGCGHTVSGIAHVGALHDKVAAEVLDVCRACTSHALSTVIPVVFNAAGIGIMHGELRTIVGVVLYLVHNAVGY